MLPHAADAARGQGKDARLPRHPRHYPLEHDPIVVTGLGVIASVGDDTEAVWQAIQRGQSGVRPLTGLAGVPDGLLIGAPVDAVLPRPGEIKVVRLCHHAAAEAIADATIDWNTLDRSRFGCWISAGMGDTDWFHQRLGWPTLPDSIGWWNQWMANAPCASISAAFDLRGPSVTHSTACASGLIDVISAVQSIQLGECDIALAGSGEAITPLIAAGFHRMRVLAHHDDPTRACRPFDVNRNGFVMGEGAGMLVLERLSHALDRGAKIYCEIAGAKHLAEAHHVTGLDANSETLSYLISRTLRQAHLKPEEIGYINCHGTGTEQNDVAETAGIRDAFGPAAHGTCVSSIKSMIGHLVNGSGSVELAITCLALRDGFAPPTINLTDPDPRCDLDCIPLSGRKNRVDNALKLSVAFGGHLAAVAIKRWNDAATGFGYPEDEAAAEPLRRAA